MASAIQKITGESQMKYEIISINKLRPLEKVFPTHLKNLEKIIKDDGYILKPLIIDSKRGIVLDGSHRYAFFLKNGYEEVPVYFVDYDDENVRVGSRLKHRFLIDDICEINKGECIKRAITGNLFSPRTTRHFFTFRKTDISLPLSSLKKGDEKSIDHLLSDVDSNFELEHNKNFISEIDEELDIIVNYLSEVNETKRYLLKQVKLIQESKKIAFFPGKFHPPHIGHVKTIFGFLNNYKKVIVCVSGHIPNDPVTTPMKIFELMKAFFKDYDNIEVMFLNEVLVKKKNLEGLPKFDVLLSGNEEVLEWAKSQNLGAEFCERSEGFLLSGTKIRELLNEECSK
jgi:nicotinamide mononucleotide adenylyltransferase